MVLMATLRSQPAPEDDEASIFVGFAPGSFWVIPQPALPHKSDTFTPTLPSMGKKVSPTLLLGDKEKFLLLW